MSIWWSLHLRREAASVPLARRLLLGTMETAGVDREISYELAVALSEACANAVEHGTNERTDAYRVTACIDGDTCHVEVTDAGPGFPDTDTPDADASGTDASGTDTPAEHAPAEHAPAPAGAPFAPPPAPAPPVAEDGRGLRIIETLADHVRFHNRPNSGGAVVSFDKILKWRDDSLLKVS
ncbi:ATP-binding protein [Streptomyces armeniacus]|uniref:ATP-binding protein n=1 Tax=Streptomyces armeniacus TaxID=83291 RepID=A0A345XT26_9ACTN|nr:ATP-binding protein [Streptomyces armeniacus]AXK34792.1 ATP-binding protein [Streptomyces armeniacus]